MRPSSKSYEAGIITTMRTVIIFALFVVLYALFLVQPGLVDFDEASVAEISRTMLATGDFLSPQLNGSIVLDKPPFVFWTEAAGMTLLGQNTAGVRLMNILAAVLVLGLCYLSAKRILGLKRPEVVVPILGTSLIFMSFTCMAMVDVWLMLWETTALVLLFCAVEPGRENRQWFLFACAAAAAGFLTKGVVAFLLPGVAGLCYLLLERRLKLVLRPGWLIPGLIVAAAPVAVWCFALASTGPGGLEAVEKFFFVNQFHRFAHVTNGHSGSPLYFVIILLGGFLPWSGLLPAAWYGAIHEVSDVRRRFLRLAIIFVCSTVVFFTFSATKLPGYVLPIYPFLALLAATAVDRVWYNSESIPLKLAPKLQGGICAVALLVAGLGIICLRVDNWWNRIAPVLNPKSIQQAAIDHPGLFYDLPSRAGILLCGLIYAVGGLAVCLLIVRRRNAAAFWSLAGVMWSGTFVFSLLFLPSLDHNFMRPLRTLAQEASRRTQPNERILLLGVRHSPSVNFYAKRNTVFVPTRDTAPEYIYSVLEQPGPRIGIAPEIVYRQWLAPDRATVLSRVDGYVLFERTER